jgi:hypothetical protein
MHLFFPINHTNTILYSLYFTVSTQHILCSYVGFFNYIKCAVQWG